MATKGNKKTNYEANEAFLQYEEEIVIIVEQSKRMPFIPEDSDEKSVHVICFSRNKEDGRYGFLNEVYNPEDQ